MEPIEFACLFEKLQKVKGIYLDSDIVSQIYNYYERKYDNYTLVELLYYLNEDTQLRCDWNKKSLIEMIRNFKIDIPEKDCLLKPSTWDCMRIRQHNDGVNFIYCIYIYDFQFEINSGDIIKLSDNETYQIDIDRIEDLYVDIVFVYLWNLKTQNELCIKGEDFIHLLDYEDVTILQNMNKNYFMNMNISHS